MQGLAWDVVRRYLQWRGCSVQNFTDIDNKILNRHVLGVIDGSDADSSSGIFEDMARLNVEAVPFRATPPGWIKALVYELEQKVTTHCGDVYYAVRRLCGVWRFRA